MDKPQLAHELEGEISNMPPEKQEEIVESTRTTDNGTGNNSHISHISHLKPELKSEALHGLAGDITKAIEPYSEADPVAILTNILTAFGNAVGGTPHHRVEYTDHHLNLFVAQVGETSKGRKGTGWSTPRRMFRDIDKDWSDQRVTGGLSSGEGLIYAVRDESKKLTPIKEKGRIIDYEEVVIDQGVDDKRLMLIEEELSQALKVMSREGNILSAILRQAWDGGNLNPLTKNNPLRATGAHISIIGHITKAELLRYLTATEQCNGFANRFCWFLVERSKCIPNPTGIPNEKLSPLIDALQNCVEFARKVTEIKRDEQAAKVWEKVYPELSEGKSGMMGAVISRAEAQTMRFACLYALLDESETIRTEHLNAALALWDYSEESARAIFGDSTGDTNVDTAREALKRKGSLTLTELHGLFGRHLPQGEIERVVAELQKLAKVTMAQVISERGGRPTTTLEWDAKQAK